MLLKIILLFGYKSNTIIYVIIQVFYLQFRNYEYLGFTKYKKISIIINY